MLKGATFYFLSIWWITFFKQLNSLVSGQLPPEENCSPVRIRVWVKRRVRFRIGGNQTVGPEVNWSSPVRVRVWLRVSFEVGCGGILLGGNCPRTGLFLTCMECIEWISIDLNWLCKHMKTVRTSQAGFFNVQSSQ